MADTSQRAVPARATLIRGEGGFEYGLGIMLDGARVRWAGG